MKLRSTKVFDRSKSPIGTIVLYIVASIIGLVAIGLLVVNIIIFKSNVAQYVAQGYPSAQVVQQLMLSQLLPVVFQSIGIYGGIALTLFGIGMLNQKISKCLELLVKAEVGAIKNGNTGHAEDAEQVNISVDETQQP